ncbi:hypothetical protein O181_035624 [Austropuccinia psidii MF-1]|uniref:Peptidase A2 domain-containing protein n=1 Tax=Austropuccinia psidii MF-1 TaxID=1389203 RepID=A0A9Q3HAQ3_9BASI|nr:hypothetical protein [Austropuccinia psidii MF-1]
MEIFIGKEEYPIKALVDTGAELNIIPQEIAIKASLTTRTLNMNLRGTGGNTTSLVALSEFTPIILVSGKKDQNSKRNITIINLTQKTHELSISPKRDKFCQYNQWLNNLKRKLADSTAEDELPNIVYKPIDNNEETFQILVDANEKIKGSPFKTEPKRKKVRFGEHDELSDEEIINEIEKDFKIMEEGDKKVKDTYHINFVDRALNNQEEPYEWQLEKPEFIQQTTNEEDEKESI